MPTKVAAGLLKYDAEIGQNEASMLIPLSEVIQGQKTLSDVKNAGYVGISLERDGDKLTAFSIDTYDSQKRKIEGKSVIDSPVIQDKAQGFIKQVMGAEADIASLPQYAKYKLGVAPNPYEKLFDKLTYEDIQETEGGYTTKLLTELDQIKDRAWKKVRLVQAIDSGAWALKQREIDTAKNTLDTYEEFKGAKVINIQSFKDSYRAQLPLITSFIPGGASTEAQSQRELIIFGYDRIGVYDRRGEAGFEINENVTIVEIDQKAEEKYGQDHFDAEIRKRFTWICKETLKEIMCFI